MLSIRTGGLHLFYCIQMVWRVVSSRGLFGRFHFHDTCSLCRQQNLFDVFNKQFSLRHYKVLQRVKVAYYWL